MMWKSFAFDLGRAWRIAVVKRPRYCQLGLFLLIACLSITAKAAIHPAIEREKSEDKGNSGEILRNWGLENTLNSSIEARKAWQLSRGSREVIVAVIDTGIDPAHLDLVDNLWRKPGSEKTKIINGKKVVEYEYGWDFLTNKPNPIDEFGHGTHVAGIIGATNKAKSGVAGVSPKVSIMAIRYVRDNKGDPETVANSVKAIQYAIENGADIINYSGGGATFSAAEKAAIEKAKSKGILFVAAAGNRQENLNSGNNYFYPASLGLDNIIAVASSDWHNRLVDSSNWGKDLVHVSAPGENIFSTLPNGKYGYLTGTSQACAFVTGLAALLLAKQPSLRGQPAKVRELIMASVDKQENLKSRIASGGRINAYKALAQLSESLETKTIASKESYEKAGPISRSVAQTRMRGFRSKPASPEFRAQKVR